jgi:hypothetical protein
MVTGYQMGHLIKYENDEWVYVDDNSTIKINRPCVKCHLLPTPEDYDPCLGYIEGAIAACCGHGVQDGYVMMDGYTKKLGMLK